jgi:hypothetical protein
MTTRTTSRTVTFLRAFTLSAVDGEHPAGEYAVDIDEELLEGLSYPAYRRTAIYIVLPGPGPGASQMVKVEPTDLPVLLNLKLDGVFDDGARPDPASLTVDSLLADPVIQAAIFSARRTLNEFKEQARSLIELRRARAETNPTPPMRRDIAQHAAAPIVS